MQKDTNKQNSKRAAETKQRMKEAFLELYAKIPIERISIRQITDLAGVNRGTFYVYYQDIYAMYEDVGNDFFEKLKVVVTPIITAFFKGKDILQELPEEAFFQKNKNIFQLFFVEKQEVKFLERIKKTARGIIAENLELNYDSMPWEVRYAAEYIASAQLGLLTYWIRSGFLVPIEELAALIKEINMSGPVSFMLQSKGKEQGGIPEEEFML